MRNKIKSMNTFEQRYDYVYYKIGPVVQEEKIFELSECNLQFCYYLPM